MILATTLGMPALAPVSWNFTGTVLPCLQFFNVRVVRASKLPQS
jgi:hypothetical protein